MRLRISLALAAFVAAVAALTIGVGTAGASVVVPSGAPDPGTTNIPYVAWAGETVKVVKCVRFLDTVSEAQAQSAISSPFGITAQVEDWSGDVNQKPILLNQPNATIQDTSDGGLALCFSFEVTSQKAGLAVYKLAISNNIFPLLLGGDVLDEHQFLVIWMQDQAPVINEAAGANLGDPTGTACSTRSRVSARTGRTRSATA
jgi:hypothetical protein